MGRGLERFTLVPPTFRFKKMEEVRGELGRKKEEREGRRKKRKKSVSVVCCVCVNNQNLSVAYMGKELCVAAAGKHDTQRGNYGTQ